MCLKPRPKKVIRIGEREQKLLYDTFIHSYDYKSWFNKLKLLDLVIKKPNKFISEIGDKELKEFDKKGFIKTLKSEIFFTQYHISEALFALISSFIKDKENPWIRLTKYNTSELIDVIKKIKDKKIVLSDQTIAALFYQGMTKEALKSEKVIKSIKFIKSFLDALAEEYLNHYSYNAYKHGQRLMSGKSTIKLNKKHEDLWEKTSDSHIMLKDNFIRHDEKENVSYYGITFISESFDYKRSFRISSCAIGLIRNIFETRKNFQKSKESSSDKPLKLKIWLYHRENLKDIFKISNEKVDFTINFPA